MSESKSPLDRIYRLIASHAWMTENEAKVLLVMMYASGTKSLGLEGKGLNPVSYTHLTLPTILRV